MANVPFQYDDELLSSCATSPYADAILSADNKLFGAREETSNNKVDPSCQELFRQFASHFGREADTTDINPMNHDRLHRFVANAVFVNRHNNGLLGTDGVDVYDDDDDDGDDDEHFAAPRHRVALNQFSDRYEHELPLMGDDIAEQFLPDFDSLPLLGAEHESGKSQLAEDATSGPKFSKLEYTHFLKSHEESSSLLGFGFPMRRGSADAGAFRSYFSSVRRNFEDEVSPLPGSASSSSPVFIWSKKGQSSIYLERETDRRRHSVRKDKMDGSDATPYAPPSDGHDAGGFLKSLDWSTTNNPDGVPIVHPVIDQGSCGSCWAISATGTVEANAARHRAFLTYTETEKKLTAKHQNSKATDMVREAAVAAAREAEAKAFSKADLSIQELVDCDTRYDQGCTGGNPLLAYYFIHRYGLTSATHYPYKGKQRECKVDQVTSPIATAESWGVLTPNHEENMELVLRYIGPIAVGVNGADPSFLAYEGGIFHSKKCGQNANHAMLIVGYGQETDRKSGKVTRYWIARNSWGIGWGEKGYVRMKRGSGKKGKRGVCGIARSPSVALGSSLLASEGRSNLHSKTLQKSHGRVQANRLKWPWVEALVRCQDRAGAPISCSDYRNFAQHLTMASVVLTMVVVGTWLRAKLTRSPTIVQNIQKDEHQVYQPTGNRLVDSLEISSSDERTHLISGGASERDATAYGSSKL